MIYKVSHSYRMIHGCSISSKALHQDIQDRMANLNHSGVMRIIQHFILIIKVEMNHHCHINIQIHMEEVHKINSNINNIDRINIHLLREVHRITINNRIQIAIHNNSNSSKVNNNIHHHQIYQDTEHLTEDHYHHINKIVEYIMLIYIIAKVHRLRAI